MKIHVLCVLAIMVAHNSYWVNAAEEYIWQISDIHFDPTYWTTQDSCNEKIAKLGKYGDFECDPPLELVQNAITAMKTTAGSPKFVMWVGDNPAHPKDQTKLTAAIRLQVATNLTNLIKASFAGIKVVTALGNHDYDPINQLPDSNNDQYNKYYELWKEWIPAAEAANFKKAGYYKIQVSTDPAPKAYAVVLNTNLYAKENDAATGEDPGGQFAWLTATLKAAKAENAKVHLVTHQPPGIVEGTGLGKVPLTFWLKEAYNKKLNKIIRDNADVLIGVYTGHHHADSFRIFYKDDGTPAASLFIAPSVTPWRDRKGRSGTTNVKSERHNPALRRIVYDNSNYKILDIETFFLDLKKANKEQGVNWVKEYSYKANYGVQNVSPETLDDLVKKKFAGADTQEFDKYIKFQFVNTEQPKDIPSGCGCDCRSQHVCAIQNVDHDKYHACIKKDSLSCKSDDGESSSVVHLSSTVFVLSLAFIAKWVW